MWSGWGEIHFPSKELDLQYFRFLFTGVVLVWQIGVTSTVMKMLYKNIVVKRELSRSAKLLVYQSIHVTTLSYGHKL